jgi:NhaP-type Na+/H+ or K+/H+ antiporter
MAFNLAEFKKSRKNKWWIGILLFWGGLVFGLIDSFTLLPTAVKAELAFAWVTMLIVGGIFWWLSKRLPIEEAMSVAALPQYQGELTVADLSGEIYVTVDTSKKILDAAVEKGQATLEIRGDTLVWIFPDIKKRFNDSRSPR